MDLRLRNLEQLDARAVPLPHGTEVVTRVDRLVGERRVPQGAVGRVTRVEGEQLDVTIVGMGVVQYARNELSPRRVGQVLFAHRRADIWNALRPCVVLEATVGSHAWGLADEDSDIDRRGVFALPFSWTQGLVAPPEDLVSADGSATYWAAGKAIRQALRADPNTLEMLFLPDAKPVDVIGEWLLAEREAFVSVEIYGTFGRYALGQLRRLEQGLRLAEHRGVVLEWLRGDPTLSLDEVAEMLAKVATRAMPSEADRVHQAKQYIKQLYRSMADQGLLDANDFGALARFAREKSADFELPGASAEERLQPRAPPRDGDAVAARGDSDIRGRRRATRPAAGHQEGACVPPKRSHGSRVHGARPRTGEGRVATAEAARRRARRYPSSTHRRGARTPVGGAGARPVRNRSPRAAGGHVERMKPAERIDEVLSPEQRVVMDRVLQEEEARREHVVVYLSGAHAYGFPSPDSDLDLKAIHVAKTADLLGFEVPPPTSDRAELIDGVEVDYTSNELAHALSGILGGNGNFLERVLGRMTAMASPLLEELRGLARRSLSRRVHRHYRGFAQNQLRFLEKEPTVGLDPELLHAWRPRVDALFARLDEARERSVLPDEPANEREARDWLLGVRRARFG